MRRLIFVTVAWAVLSNSSPTWAANDRSPAHDDPWESFNRGIYAFNQGLDRAIIRPVSMAYKRITPSPIRAIIRNFLSNLSEPKVIANDILQMRPTRAVEATGRFVINSVVGIGGIIDVATELDIPAQDNGFTITLGRYGVPQGPYFYIPVGGPATIRSLVGTVADGFLDPLYFIRYPYRTEVGVSLTVVHGLDLRAENDGALKALTADATDPYATIRSAYLQNQESLVNEDRKNVQALPDFEDLMTRTPAPRPTAPSPDAQTPQDQTPKDQTPPDAPKAPDAATPAPPMAANASPTADAPPPAAAAGAAAPAMAAQAN